MRFSRSVSQYRCRELLILLWGCEMWRGMYVWPCCGHVESSSSALFPSLISCLCSHVKGQARASPAPQALPAATGGGAADCLHIPSEDGPHTQAEVLICRLHSLRFTGDFLATAAAHDSITSSLVTAVYFTSAGSVMHFWNQFAYSMPTQHVLALGTVWAIMVCTCFACMSHRQLP